MPFTVLTANKYIKTQVTRRQIKGSPGLHWQKSQGCHSQNYLSYYEIMKNVGLKINFLHQNYDCGQIITCFR